MHQLLAMGIRKVFNASSCVDKEGQAAGAL